VAGSETPDNIRFHHGPLPVDGFNFIQKTAQHGLPLPFQYRPLGRAQILDAHPRPQVRWLSASVVSQKRAGLSRLRYCLAHGDGHTGQVKKQKVPEIEPDRIGDTTGFGAKPAGPATQGDHQGDDFIDAATDRLGGLNGGLQYPAMSGQQAGQGAVGFSPRPGIAGRWRR